MDLNKYNGVINVERKLDEWAAGLESGITYEDRGVDWALFRPLPETQSLPAVDPSTCVNQSWHNSIESQIDWLVKTSKLTARQVSDLITMDYLNSDLKCNLSDRYLAILSGTTINGNSGAKVADTFVGNSKIKGVGAIPESELPKEGGSFAEYMNPSKITERMRIKGDRFFDYFDVKHEWVDVSFASLVYHLKQAPLQIFTPVCPTWNSGNVMTCGDRNVRHATELLAIDTAYQIEDTYNPINKTLSLDYPVGYAKKIVVTPKPEKKTNIHFKFTKELSYGMTNNEVTMLQKVLIEEGLLKVNPTGYFGENTRKAVHALQMKYFDFILKPANLATSTGRVGQFTRTFLNNRA